MAKKPKWDNLEQEEILWRDRKRVLGMPLSFTVYEVTKDRLIRRRGFLRTETDELLLYRILDFKLVRSLGQKICGVGTITLYTVDQSSHTLELKNIKHSEKVQKYLSKLVESQRAEKGITGREIYGTATSGMSHEECENEHPPFFDADGDGRPD